MTKGQYETLNIISSFILSLVIIFLPFQYEEILHAGKSYLWSPLIVPILVLLKGGKIFKIFFWILGKVIYFIFRFFKVKLKLKAIGWTFLKFPRVKIYFGKLGEKRDSIIEQLFVSWKMIGSFKKQLIVFLAWLPVTVILFFIMISYSVTVRKYVYKYIGAFFTEYHFEKREKRNS